MKNVEKLLKLMRIAHENGWDGSGTYGMPYFLKECLFNDENTFQLNDSHLCCYQYTDFESVSINDIVCGSTKYECESGSTSFLSALLNATQKMRNAGHSIPSIHVSLSETMHVPNIEMGEDEMILYLWNLEHERTYGRGEEKTRTRRRTGNKLELLFAAFKHLL